MPSASFSLGAQGFSADASAFSALASMPSDTNLQVPGANDEAFAQETGTEFELSVYSDVLDQKLANIRTPVVPRPERSSQPEAARK